MIRRPTFFLLPLLFLLPSVGAESSLKGRVIVLDPGHGAIDYENRVINPGRETTQGQVEHKLTLEICQKIGKSLEKSGARVIYTRTNTDYWRQSYGTIEDNKNRSVFADQVGADVFISIHCDWYPLRKFRGVTTFYAKPQSKRLGQLVHRKLVTQLKARDRKLVFDSYTVLDNISIPAVLVECGFLSNREESKKLGQSSYQLKIGKAVSEALETYFKETALTKRTSN